MKFKFLIIFFLLCFSAFRGVAQNISVKASIDTNKIFVGDQVQLKVKAFFPSKTLVKWPDLRDSLANNVEIVKKSKIDTVKKEGGSITLQQAITITSFDSGSFYIPQILFNFKNAGDTGFSELLTDSILLNVNTVKVDTTKAIRDIKGPLTVPWTFREMLPYIIGVIALVGIVWFIFYYLKKRRKGEKLIDFSKPALPPHIIALQELKALQDKKLWQNSFVKAYYTELTDITRTYIEKRFTIAAMEMTTDEIVSSLKNIEMPATVNDKLGKMLVLADLVKFAKADPLPNEHELSINAAIEFVNSTKSVENKDNSDDRKNIDENQIENTLKTEDGSHAE